MNDRIRMLKARALNSRQLADPRAAEWRAGISGPDRGPAGRVARGRGAGPLFPAPGRGHSRGRAPGWHPSGPDGRTRGKVVPAIFGRQAFQGHPAWLAPGGPDDSFEVFFRDGLLSWAGNHKTLDYQRVFDVGILGLMDQIEARLARVSAEEQDARQKRDFLLALRIVAQGFLDLSERYAAQAQELASACEDPVRKAELETIASNCRRVPAQPPTTFWEACQCAWFAFYLVPDAPGRVDQYLYPWYAQDVRRGTLTREFALELLANLWCKYFESVGGASGVSAHNHLTLGGVHADGRDASNDLTYLCLEVVEDTRLYRPQVGLRWNRQTPPALLKRAVRALRAGTGNPDLCSDEQIVPALVRVGVSRGGRARLFALRLPRGDRDRLRADGLGRGVHQHAQDPAHDPGPGAGAAEGRRSGSARFLRGFVGWPCFIPWSLWRDRRTWPPRSATARRPSAPAGQLEVSLVTRDCIEKARGYTQGGARYNFCNWNVIGIANLVDALAAIREWVYEQRALSLEELVAILATDWAGRESLRREILAGSAHFGNDRPEVDAIAGRVIAGLDGVLKRRTPFRGGEYILGTTAGGENMHIEFGRVTGATPDGRKAASPLADSLGAAQGRDRCGVTALLNSVAALPHQLLPTATTLNVKLDPTLLESDTGLEGIAALVEAHFRSGGQQLQFNLVSRETLLDAKRHPEQYPNLMVRVAGYSAPFTSLWGDLQDEIIARTAHALSC